MSRANYPTGAVQFLSVPESSPNPDFFAVLDCRTSNRLFRNLEQSQLESLLWHSMRVKNVRYSEVGNLYSFRPAPSAGAIHPIDLILFPPGESECPKLFDPFSHALKDLVVSTNKVNSFLEHVDHCLDRGQGTLLWFAAQPELTAAKYDSPASLYWRDAGALLATVQLVATALGQNACPLGTLGDGLLEEIFPGLNIVSVGGMIVG